MTKWNECWKVSGGTDLKYSSCISL